MKPHIHAEFIKAWADGKEIQYRLHPEGDWIDAAWNPNWSPLAVYRIKPQPKSPGQILAESYSSVPFNKDWSLLNPVAKASWEILAKRFLEAYEAETAGE